MIVEDKENESLITSMVTDEAMQKELLLQDEEEDFLDEGSSLSHMSAHLYGFDIFSKHKRVRFELSFGATSYGLQSSTRNHRFLARNVPELTKVFAALKQGATTTLGTYV